MPEAREKARALLAEVKAGSVPLRDAADATKALAQSLGLLAALCDENDALRQRAAAAEAGAAAMRDVERRMSNEVVRLMDELATAHFRTENATAARDRAQGRLDNQCAGLVQMARDRDAALAERDALRAELAKVTAVAARESSEVEALKVERDVADRECDRLRAQVDADRQELTRMAETAARLKAIPAALCVCVAATYSFDPGRNVIGQRAGYTITAGVGCPACRGTGIAIVEGGA